MAIEARVSKAGRAEGDESESWECAVVADARLRSGKRGLPLQRDWLVCALLAEGKRASVAQW